MADPDLTLLHGALGDAGQLAPLARSRRPSSTRWTGVASPASLAEFSASGSAA
jgi:hypothetical protein